MNEGVRVTKLVNLSHLGSKLHINIPVFALSFGDQCWALRLDSSDVQVITVLSSEKHWIQETNVRSFSVTVSKDKLLLTRLHDWLQSILGQEGTHGLMDVSSAKSPEAT